MEISISAIQMLWAIGIWILVGLSFVYWVARKQFSRTNIGDWVLSLMGVLLWPAVIMEILGFCRAENEHRLSAVISKYQSRFGRLPSNTTLKILQQQSKLSFISYIADKGIRCLY